MALRRMAIGGIAEDHVVLKLFNAIGRDLYALALVVGDGVVAAGPGAELGLNGHGLHLLRCVLTATVLALCDLAPIGLEVVPYALNKLPVRLCGSVLDGLDLLGCEGLAVLQGFDITLVAHVKHGRNALVMG